jgi:CheY-like chemotaxis protein
MEEKIVLHIDDDEDDQMLVREAILQFDHTILVQAAPNGDHGLSVLKAFKDANRTPCLILLDLNMPGMTSDQIVTLIQKDEVYKNIPLIIFTTSSAARDKEFALRRGVAFLTKPSSHHDLIDCMQKLLGNCT